MRSNFTGGGRLSSHSRAIEAPTRRDPAQTSPRVLGIQRKRLVGSYLDVLTIEQELGQVIDRRV